MKIGKLVSTGALALTLSLTGLAVGTTGCASTSGAAGATPGTSADKGADHSCGAKSCGEKSCGASSEKKAPAKEDKGASASCGAKSCG